jgi:hypothetical protein
LKRAGVTSTILVAILIFVAACSSQNAATSVLPAQGTPATHPLARAANSTNYPGVLTAGPMPTPLTLAASASGNIRRMIDIPGNIEIVPAAIPGSALSAVVHIVPSPPPSPLPTPMPTATPCHNTCLCLQSVPVDGPSASICPNGGTSQSALRPMNTVLAGDHEQAGYYIYASPYSGVGDIYVAMTASTSILMPTPPQGGVNQLYAPTTHGPMGNCLEASTDYFNGYGTAGSTVSELQIWDFCKGGWGGAVPMDSTFFSNYVRVYSNGNGMPEYLLELAEGTDAKWHAYIYNNNNQYWDDVYDSAPNGTVPSQYQGGWSAFETYYGVAGEQCPSAGTIGESGLRLHYSTGWGYASAAPYGVLNGGSCFSTSGVTSPYYSLSATPSSDMAWTVTSH